MDEKKSKLRRMAVWTIVVFAAIFASVLAALWMALYNMGTVSASGAVGQAFGSGWPILLIDLVLCAGAFFVYRYFLNRQK
ncbi:MAG: hypothetical protein ABSA23_12695 [Anaerolineales bacterium]|jgi:hypothetical protein